MAAYKRRGGREKRELTNYSLPLEGGGGKVDHRAACCKGGFPLKACEKKEKEGGHDHLAKYSRNEEKTGYDT